MLKGKKDDLIKGREKETEETEKQKNLDKKLGQKEHTETGTEKPVSSKNWNEVGKMGLVIIATIFP